MKPAARLWRWFQSNARDLPWRAVRKDGTRDPYHVWLAEIMLQQTQVRTVIAYYEKFLRHYPDLKSLAGAAPDKVFADWAGLGYYSRARNLHACARTVMDQLGGQWPRTAAELQKLPGLGPYTAAAMAALAFGENTLAIDGNVARVLSRVGAIETPAASARAQLLSVGEKLLHLPARGGSAEALIELGALICTPKNPKCDACPLRADCRAYALGRVEDFPVKIKAKTPKALTVTLLVLTDPNGKVFTITRGRGLFAGMTALPSSALSATEENHILYKAYGGSAKKIGAFEHVLTHIKFKISVSHVQIKARDAARISKLGKWQDTQQVKKQMPKLFAKAIYLLAA